MSANSGAMTFTDSKERFSNRVADYLRYRPGYPAAVIEASFRKHAWDGCVRTEYLTRLYFGRLHGLG